MFFHENKKKREKKRKITIKQIDFLLLSEIVYAYIINMHIYNKIFLRDLNFKAFRLINILLLI